ncbi:MAG TPA: organomercurial lyase [Thermoanaerobaculia bacterium]
MSIDDDVRRHVYDVTMREGTPPSASRLGELASLPPGEVAASLERLAAARMLVLRDGEVLMAGPFSAVPTPFRVTTPTFTCYGNCIWDGLGIAATLQCDVDIDTSCGDCGAAMRVAVRGAEVRGSGTIHFALPARQWWQDIVFT